MVGLEHQAQQTGWRSASTVWCATDPAVSPDDGGNALRHLGGHLRPYDQSRIVVRMHIDEARAHHEAAHVNIEGRSCLVKGADLGDAVARNGHVGGKGGAPGSIDNRSVPQHNVKVRLAHRRLGRPCLCTLTTLQLNSTPMKILPAEHARKKLRAQPGSLHRSYEAVDNFWYDGHQFTVVPRVECAHALLDERIRLAERHMYCRSVADRPDAVVRSKWPMISCRHARDLTAFGESTSPGEVHHHHVHRVAVKELLVWPAAPERLARAYPHI